MTLKKEDIVTQLMKKCDMKRKEARIFVSAFFDEMVSTLENGFNIRMSGFGNFLLRDKTPRPGRNPKTGEDCTISSRRVVTFKTGVKMKKYINGELSK